MFHADNQLFCGPRHEKAYAIPRTERQQQRLLGQREEGLGNACKASTSLQEACGSCMLTGGSESCT